MIERIGVAVTEGSIRIVRLRGRKVVAAAQEHLSPSEPLTTPLRKVLRRLHVRPSLVPPVNIVVGPALSQVRQIRGLPPIRSVSVMGRLIRENYSRFFPLLEGDLVLSGIQLSPDGSVFAGVVTFPVIERVWRACNDTRIPLRRIVPFEAAVAFGFNCQDVDFTDGGMTLTIASSAGQLTSVRRHLVGDPSAVQLMEPRRRLTNWQQWDRCYSDAIASAVFEGKCAFGASASAVLPAARRRHRERVGRVALLCAGVAAAAMVAPLPRVLNASHTLRRNLEAISPAAAEASSIRLQTAAAQDRLAEVRTVTGMRSMLAMIRGFGEALPDSSAIAELRLGPTGGSITVLTTQPAEFLRQLERNPEIRDLSIAGATRGDGLLGENTERLVIDFELVETGRR